MKRKSILAIVLAVMMFACCLLTGCGEDTYTVTPPTLQNTQTFVTLVDGIETPITVGAGVYIDAAYLVYNALTDAEKSDSEVVGRKTKLDEYKSSYDIAKAEAEAEAERQREEKRKAAFIAAVNALSEDLSFEDRDAVSAAYDLYFELKSESKTDTTVAAAYEKLKEIDAEVAELEELEFARYVKETAEKFIADVEELVGEDEDYENNITLDSAAVIEDLVYAYEDFEDEIKEYEGVAEAKEKLDKAVDAYQILRDADDVEKFLEYAEALLPVESITLESENSIIKAEKLYRDMSDNAKTADGIAEALETVKAAREAFDELFAADQAIKIAAFIAAVEEINPDTTDLDITWFDVLDAANQTYQAIAYELRSQAEVVEAYNKWNAVQKVFDSKGYDRIPMLNPTLQFSGDAPPFLVMPNYKNTTEKLCEFYGVDSVTELSEKVILWLNVYTIDDEGNYVFIARGALDVALMNSNIIHSDKIKPVMSKLADEHEQIVNGGVYGFSLNFDDADGKYIPSSMTNIVYDAGKPYTW